MRHKNVTILFTFVLLFIINAAASDLPLKVIPAPEPNLKEKNFIRLEKVGEIGDEVAKDEFLFSPYSVTMDMENNLFIYDRMQAKILKFDPSFKFVKAFGGVGQGPSEFSGSGKHFGVSINVGQDGRLLAYDHMAYKVSVFNGDGKFIKHIKVPPSLALGFREPLVDKDGNLILQEFRKDRLVVFNQKGVTLFSIMNKEQKKEYLFRKPKVYYGGNREFTASIEEPFSYDAPELRMKITSDSMLILYFACSAALYVKDLNGKKETRKFRIWPEEALKLRKEDNDRKDFGYALLFGRIFLDKDQNDIFYLNFGKNKSRGSHCVYRMNLEGKLLAVLYTPIKGSNVYPRFVLKQDNLFFAIEDEKVVIYQEVKK